MRILLGYSDYRHPVSIRGWIEAGLARLRAAGFLVTGFPLTLHPPGPRLTWPDLDTRWKQGDRTLLAMYEDLARTLEHFEVFVNWNGINLHPDFVRQLPTFNVYGCFDDPEASDDLSRPVAAAYDLAMVGNIAELDRYRSWGVKEVRFWPLGFRLDDYDPNLTRDKIITGERDIDVALLCERVTGWRSARLADFSAAFPSGAFYGTGWPNGFLPDRDRIALYQRTRIGPNFHNSTGPVNFRTYILPANGVLQICDNKSQLGKIFELGREVIGCDNVKEAIDLTRYYLNHDEERRRIAAAGWERAVRDYNERAVFSLLEKYVNEVRHGDLPTGAGAAEAIRLIRTQRRNTTHKRIWSRAADSVRCLRGIATRGTKR